MTNAQALANTLASAYPEINAHVVPYEDRAKRLDAFHGPIITVADGLLRGVSITVHGNDCDNLDKICADIYRSVSPGVRVAEYDEEGQSLETELLLSFAGRRAILDEFDFRVGEEMQFHAVLCSSAQAQAA